MKVNQKILSIPPYISTSWKNVISLHMDEKEENTLLVIGLVNGSTIEIPNLEKATLLAVFDAHEKFLEEESSNSSAPKGVNRNTPFSPTGMIDESTALLNLPIRFGIEGNMSNILQHNPEASDIPDLPKEVIERIYSLSKTMGFENGENFPKAEPHCNCMHCQIMRAIHQNEEKEDAQKQDVEEEVSPEDLTFRDWDITQSGDKCYIVTNPLNTEEKYNVYLGNPVGCTCGQPNCEHIRYVLNS